MPLRHNVIITLGIVRGLPLTREGMEGNVILMLAPAYRGTCVHINLLTICEVVFGNITDKGLSVMSSIIRISTINLCM